MSSESESDRWLQAVPDGVMLAVHVGPGASRAGVAGFHGNRLRVRVTAPPAGGAANRELVQVLASVLGVRPSAVSIEHGGGTRQKLVRVRGLRPDEARARLVASGSVDSGGSPH